MTHLPSSLRGMGCSLGRKSRRSMVNQVMKDEKMKGMVLSKVGKVIIKELTQLSKRNSCFTDKGLSAIERFDWTVLVAKLKRAAPSFYSLLDVCTPRKSGLQKDIVIIVCGSILLRSHSSKANLFQRLVSVLLFASHAPKQVCV